MAAQGDEQDLRRQVLELTHRVEAEPALTRRVVGPPLAHRVDLDRPVAFAHHEAAALGAEGVVLHAGEVDLGLRKILDPARVVEVQVGDHDVADVPRRMAERLHLAQRCLTLVQADVQHGREGAAEPRKRSGHVLQAIAGVDQHQARGVGLDQQTMTDQMPQEPLRSAVEQRAAERAVGPAVQVVHAHDGASRAANPAGAALFRVQTFVWPTAGSGSKGPLRPPRQRTMGVSPWSSPSQ